MTQDELPDDLHGLGGIQSPPDDRDFTMAQLLADSGQQLTAALPASFTLGTLPPVLNQGNTPMCVAFSHSALKAFEDRRDQGRFFDFDEPRFFAAIGGGPNGAVIRVALDRLLKVGYPVVSAGDASHHRIRAYYAIPKTQAAISQAIHDFGPLEMGSPWYHSWFRPVGAAGSRTLPAPDYVVGGHAYLAVGYTPAGVILRNSWGSAWGDGGNAIMRWAYVLHSVWEVWKALDVIDTTTLWGPDVPADVRAVDPSGRRTSDVFSKAGSSYGSVIEMADLIRMFDHFKVHYGTVVQGPKMAALFKAAGV